MRLLVYYNLSCGYRAAVQPGADLVEADLADRAMLDEVFTRHRIDAVMQFAALI